MGELGTLDPRIRARINEPIEELFGRYGQVIRDPASPFRSIRIIVSHEAGAPYFEKLMSDNRVRGVVVVRE